MKSRLIGSALALSMLSACVSTSVFAPTTSCSSLVPDEFRERTEHTPAPEKGADPLDTLKNWINFGVGQTAKVEDSDDRRIAAIGIIERCEERDREAIKRAAPGKLNLSGLRD